MAGSWFSPHRGSDNQINTIGVKKMDDSRRDKKPRIIPSPNGPFHYITDFEPKPVRWLTGIKGEELSTFTYTALCRCGGSSNKPFCDGTHGKIHFNDRKETARNLYRRKSYTGKMITISDNRGLCSHARFCVENLPSVFEFGARPWINPDGATVEEIIRTVKMCPSGALSYTIEGVEFRKQDREPMVTVMKDGPLCITGGVEVQMEESSEHDGSKEHCTLCRCGSSKNKPYCDGAHKDIGFKDD